MLSEEQEYMRASVASSSKFSNDEEGDMSLEGSDDEGVDEKDADYTQSNRSTTTFKPVVGTAAKRRRLKAAPTKAKKTGKSRNVGKLAQLMNMPMDVFFEIASHLEPLDILQLSRVSKHFRSTFARQGSRHIWVASRRNIYNMPDCPPDMSEPQYAALMFEHNCHVCGKSRANKADYSLRVNFCGACFTENVKKGSAAIRPFGRLPLSIFQLLPRSMLKNQTEYTQPFDRKAFNAKNNSKNNAYYVPEVQVVVKRYQALLDDQSALDTFVAQQQKIATEIMDSAVILNDWVLNSKTEKKTDDKGRADKRKESIEARLIEIGWERKYFPTWDYRWTTILQQPRELTDRIWKAILPKLEVLLKEKKTLVLQIERDQRLVTRRAEFSKLWISFMQLQSDEWNEEERALNPKLNDIYELPSVSALLSENEACNQVTEDVFILKAHLILAERAELMIKIKRDLAKMLTPSVPPSEDDSAVDLGILDHATSLFPCSRLYSCKQLLPYPAILLHEHSLEEESRWELFKPRIQPKLDLQPTIRKVLDILCISKDGPAAAVKELDGRCVCFCGHPNQGVRVDFGTLIRHLVEENDWFDRREHTATAMDNSSSLILQNDHDLSASKQCFAVLSADELVKFEERQTTAIPFVQPKRCALCWQKSRANELLRSDDEVTYHMKAKHAKEADEDDALTYSEYLLWKARMGSNDPAWW